MELPRINITQKSVTFHEHTKVDDGPCNVHDKLSDDEEEVGPAAAKPQELPTETERTSKLENPKVVSKYCFRLPKVPPFKSLYPESRCE